MKFNKQMIMTRGILIIFTISISLIHLGCEPQDEDEPETKVQAGITNNYMQLNDSIHEYINVSLDSTENFYFGSDSVDINSDGNYDFIFDLRYMANDSLNENVNPYDYPY
jgi:hypothetical protein